MSRYERYNHDEMPHDQPPLLCVESSGWRPIGRQSIFLKSNEFYHRSPQLGVISHDQNRSGHCLELAEPLVGPENSSHLIMLKKLVCRAMLQTHELCVFFRDHFFDGRVPLPTVPSA